MHTATFGARSHTNWLATQHRFARLGEHRRTCVNSRGLRCPTRASLVPAPLLKVARQAAIGVVGTVVGSVTSAPFFFLQASSTLITPQLELDSDTLAACLLVFFLLVSDKQRQDNSTRLALFFAILRSLSHLHASSTCTAVPLDCSGSYIDSVMAMDLILTFAESFVGVAFGLFIVGKCIGNQERTDTVA